jgi:F-type H+-transporting ATPase subunit b
MAKMEAEIYELKQRQAFASEIKSNLDAWVRFETSVRERQQKLLASHVQEQVQAKLADPKIVRARILLTMYLFSDSIACSKTPFCKKPFLMLKVSVLRVSNVTE